MPSHPSRLQQRRVARLVLAGLASATTLLALDAGAQGAYPDKPLRFVVPQPAGGTGDVISRMVTQSLSNRLRQPIVVENRPGAGGSLGAGLVAKAAPDGYTLVLSSPGFSTFVALYKSLNFNPATELTGVGMMGIVPVAVVVRTESPFKTLAEMLDFAKKNPGKLTFASAGNGSLSHLIGSWFKVETNTDLLHVPYAGTAPALTSAMGGQVDMLFDPMSSAGMMKSGRARALAVAEAKRSPLLPDVPTLTELGVNVRGSVWLGVSTTGGTPRAIIDRLNRELEASLKEPELRTKMLATGVAPEIMSVTEINAFLEADSRNLTKLVRDNNVKVE